MKKLLNIPIFNFVSKANIIKSVFLSVLILCANTANAYNPKDTERDLLMFFFLIALVVFVFIMGAVNYFKKEPEDEQPDASQDLIKTETQDEPQSNLSYVLRKSFLIFVMLIIICIIVATLSMDA